MSAWIDQTIQAIQAHRTMATIGGIAAAVLILSLVAGQAWGAYRGRTLAVRASVGFAVVQTGVAYVTITGVYGFWAHAVGMPAAEAALIAVFIEAVTWAAVGMIFAYGAEEDSQGPGPAGALFWWSVAGGGVMAVLGSPSLAVAAGRAVVVALGGMMWHLRIRQRTRRAVARAATRLTVTPRQIMLRTGLLIADDADVIQTSYEWQVRQLARAVRRAAAGRPVSRWRGQRTIVRVMESGNAAMVRDAQSRYALARVLQDDLTDGSPSMTRAIEAARDLLYPQTHPIPDTQPPIVPLTRPTAHRSRPAVRTAAATAARTDPASAATRKADAVRVAQQALASNTALTGKDLGDRFGLGEEWGRQRLIEARAATNGHTPGT